MILFEKFKEKIPSNEELIQESLMELVGEKIMPETVKKDFSNLVEKIHDSIYKKYLGFEKKAGNELIREHFDENKSKKSLFKDLNNFYMSVFQSRKVRAGKVFETIISTLFKKCAYPFSEQAVINGKPDFLLPSESHYKENPMSCIIFTAKRTLRERWRQIVTEGAKAYGFFLTTLDDNITKAQLNEMKNNKIYLVLPKNKIKSNPVYVNQINVISYEDFFEDHLDPAVKRWDKNSKSKEVKLKRG